MGGETLSLAGLSGGTLLVSRQGDHVENQCGDELLPGQPRRGGTAGLAGSLVAATLCLLPMVSAWRRGGGRGGQLR